jgi:restriction system protein
MAVPSHTELFNPTLQAIKRLGDSASNLELNEEVISNLKLGEKDLAQPHDERQTEVEYRLSWARTYLKIFGLLENSSRGIWVLTPKGKETEYVNPKEVATFARNKNRQPVKKQKKPAITTGESIEKVEIAEVAEVVLEQTWREKLSEILLDLNPSAFERLCQRILRESGFTQVTVTGKTGDGGIDGFGLVKLGGLLSFPIIFQCKRYQGSVSSKIIREFRGAMIGRADRGLVITTGTFTRDAKAEATRDGVPPIDLVDGEQLLDKLKELRLGVEIRMVEEVSILPDWFKYI